MKNFIDKYKFALGLILVSVIVCAANYEPGTILSGWDTLHPEFNFKEYFIRVIFGVWQEHQGLGTIASQSHAGELPRLLFYYISSLFIPDTLLRYFGFFVTLTLGPLGIFFFLKKIFEKNDNNELLSFSGSLFYLFNLAVVQQYYVPFEMFAIHFASLPWLFLFALTYIENKNNKDLLKFGLISFFSASMSHTATLWYVYFVSLLIFISVFSILNKKAEFFKRALKIAFTAVTTNLFWILPNLYFIKNGAEVVQNSKIHSLFSEEAFAQNASFGNIPDLLIFRNFLFNWGEYNYKGDFVKLLDEWNLHLENPLILGLGYLFSLIVIAGIVYVIRRKDIRVITLIPILFLSIFFWLNINPPFGDVFSFLQNQFGFFKEAFRFPFTKFSILLVFCGSIYFAYGISFFIKILEKIKGTKLLVIFPVFLLILFSAYMWPVFKGNLISPSMKVSIPKEYFQLFNWFQNEPNRRVATLPINSFWGWSYYNWGYQGAGFLWFGIPQPLLDREFDRWGSYNEGYYREMSQAIYSKDYASFDRVLNKYDIGYILLDENIISPGPGNDPKILFNKEAKDMIKTVGLKEVWHKGNIWVYKKTEEPIPAYIIRKAPSLDPQLIATFKDFQYFDLGDYITNDNNQDSFPLRNIIDNQNRLLSIDETQQGLNFKIDRNKYTFPSLEEFEEYFNSSIVINKTTQDLNLEIYPKSPIGDEAKNPLSIKTTAPKEGVILSINKYINFTIDQKIPDFTNFYLGQVLLNLRTDNLINLFKILPEVKANFNPIKTNYALESCGSSDTKPSFGINETENGFTIFGKNSQACLFLSLSEILKKTNLPVKEESLLYLDYKFQGGTNSNLCVMKKSERRCLSYFSTDSNPNDIRNKRVFGFDQQEINDLYLRIFIDTTEGNAKKQAVYSDFSFGLSKPMSKNSISSGRVSKLFPESRKEVSDLTFHFSGIETLSKPITSLPKTGGPCSIISYKEVLPLKKELIKDEMQDYIKYSSSEGSYCDHFSYSELPHESGYIIIITSRNIEGLPIRLCITNSVTKRCDIYTHLSKNKEFKKEYFLLPPSGSGFGYDININNFAIKGSPSINDLKSIQIIPFPYEWASRIHKKSSNGLPSYRIEPDIITKFNPSLYSILSEIKKGDVFVLPQSYEKGWKLYKVKSINILSLSLPFFFGNELGQHVIVNNWANGWLANQYYKGNLIIVYWPQYLEYLGFMISFGTLILLSFTRIWKHPKI